MKFLGGYERKGDDSRDDKSRGAPVRDPKVRSKTDYSIGRALAGDAKKTLEAKRARASDRRKRKIKYATVVSIAAVAVLLVIVIGVGFVIREKAEREAQEIAEAAANAAKDPKTPVIDESNAEVSRRVKDFVLNLEEDVSMSEFSIERVILPANKIRELHVYISGRATYFKMSLDRGSAVQTEDMQRVIKYLDERGIVPEYVDLRVEGKAYYR